MHLFKSSPVRAHELGVLLDCMPADISGLDKVATLRLWQRWHKQGSLMLSRVDAIADDGRRQLKAVGATVWLTSTGALSLMQCDTRSCAHQIYAVEQLCRTWVMVASDIEQAHASNTLNLMVLHFWSSVDVGGAEFHPIFVQAHSLFRDTHQGFGVQRLLQEVPANQAPILEAAGMHIVHQPSAELSGRTVLMEICADDAKANPGSTFSFLFFSPRMRLNLKPAVQRMLQLALQQLTDDDIAEALGCSRDYVRKLWSDAYARMEDQGVLVLSDASLPHSTRRDPTGPKRGRERRRLVLEFLRANLQEVRPGLPSHTQSISN